MAGILRLQALAQTVSLDGFGQYYGRASLRMHGGMVGGKHLGRVVTAAIERGYLGIRHCFGHPSGGFTLPEEVLARIGAAKGLECLVLTVDGFHHHSAQLAIRILGEQWIPLASPDGLDVIPAGAAESALGFLDDLAV